MSWRRAGLVLLAALLLLAGSAALGLARALAPVAPGSEPVVVELEPGAGLGAIASHLEAAGAVRHAWAFEALARWRGVGSRLRAGEYEFDPQLTAGEVLERIVRGQVRTHRVVIPEGLTAAEIALRMDDADLADPEAFLAAVGDPALAARLGVEAPALEGFLYPETYQLARGLAPAEVVQAMVEQFMDVWRGIAEPAARAGFSMLEVVTLASIVEKETGVPEERPLIASVFLNRLERGMRLETDPTVIYGIPDFDGNLRRVHLEDRSNPYNTYRIAGLPPGPIANPGGDALHAVVDPASSDYLYFVSRNDGTHQFSRTYREHVVAVNRYQKGGR